MNDCIKWTHFFIYLTVKWKQNIQIHVFYKFFCFHTSTHTHTHTRTKRIICSPPKKKLNLEILGALVVIHTTILIIFVVVRCLVMNSVVFEDSFGGKLIDAAFIGASFKVCTSNTQKLFANVCSDLTWESNQSSNNFNSPEYINHFIIFFFFS